MIFFALLVKLRIVLDISAYLTLNYVFIYKH